MRHGLVEFVAAATIGNEMKPSAAREVRVDLEENHFLMIINVIERSDDISNELSLPGYLSLLTDRVTGRRLPKDVLNCNLAGAVACLASLSSLLTNRRWSLTSSSERKVPGPSATSQLRMESLLPWRNATAAPPPDFCACRPLNPSIVRLLKCSQ